MEREMCSYLEWQLDIEQVCSRDLSLWFGGTSRVRVRIQLVKPCQLLPQSHSRTRSQAQAIYPPPFQLLVLVHHHLPHLQPPVPPEKPSRRSLVDSYLTPMDSPQLPTPPASHSNVPSLINSMSPITPSNYECESVKIICSAGSNTTQLPGDNVSPLVGTPLV